MNASNGSINTALVDSFRSFYFPFALIVAIWPKILRNSIKTNVLDALLREMTKRFNQKFMSQKFESKERYVFSFIKVGDLFACLRH